MFFLKFLKATKQCRAHAKASGQQCTRRAWRGTSYCWQHQAKLPYVLAGLLFLTGLGKDFVVDKVKSNFFPSAAVKEVRAKPEGPLKLAPLVNRGPAYRGDIVPGFPWQENFVEVRLLLSNTNGTALRDIDLAMEMYDVWIVTAKQVGNEVADVRLVPGGPSSVTWASGLDSNGQPVSLSMFPIANLPQPASSYRIHCPLLLGGATLDVFLVAAKMGPHKQGELPNPFFGLHQFPSNFLIRGTYVDDQRTPPLRYQVDLNRTF